MKTFKEKVLENFNLSEESYLDLIKDINFEDEIKKYHYDNLLECVSYIKEKVLKKEKILIYGDYDCDGFTSISILYLTLKTEDYIPGYYVPSREIDGYGLTIENINVFYKKGYNTIILIDNGITLNEQIKYAKSLGMDVIVLDHHTKSDILPDANFIIHPIYSNFVNYNMSAATIALFFSYYYLSKFDDYFITLAAISTLSDQMDLIGLNRLIVKEGLKRINNLNFYNLKKMLNKTSDINEDDLQMSLIPKINAIGRLIVNEDIFNIVRYLNDYDNREFIDVCYDWINKVDTIKKNLVNESINNIKISGDNKSIVLFDENFKEGIIGLLASKLLDVYKKPICVFANETKNKNNIKGSIRSKNGFDINLFLNENKDILIQYGGHSKAGGLTILKSQLQNFTKRFEDYASNSVFADDTKYIDISISDISYENYEFLRTLSPFGQGFNKPKFRIKNVSVDILSYSKDKNHIITKLGQNSSLVCFNYDKTLHNYKQVDFIGTLGINLFKNNITTQLIVSSFNKSNL